MENKWSMKSWKIEVKCRFVVSFLTFTFLVSIATAQVAITAAGSDVSGESGSLSYSIGQVVYQFHAGTSGSATEGVQQPYRILAAPVVKKASNKYLSFTVFPNPTTDFLFLNIENFKNENLSFQVIDIHGRVLYNQKITDAQTRFFVGNLSPAIYGILVMSNGNWLIHLKS